MAVNIRILNAGDMTLTTGGSTPEPTPSEPTAPNGKVLYKTSADGEWLESDADIQGGFLIGFNEKSSAVAVIIPSKDASGNDVTSIGYQSFSGCSGLTNVTIPDSVTWIGGSAFSGCSGLTSVTIPDNVTEIAGAAFSGCSGLTSVTIPDNVTEIGYEAFCECTGLTNVTIGNSVTNIGETAFFGCKNLTQITIPSNVEFIGPSAFAECNGLTNVTFNNFDVSTVKGLCVNESYYIFGTEFYDENYDRIEKTFRVNCTDGSFDVTFGTDRTTFTDL